MKIPMGKPFGTLRVRAGDKSHTFKLDKNGRPHLEQYDIIIPGPFGMFSRRKKNGEKKK